MFRTRHSPVVAQLVSFTFSQNHTHFGVSTRRRRLGTLRVYLSRPPLSGEPHVYAAPLVCTFSFICTQNSVAVGNRSSTDSPASGLLLGNRGVQHLIFRRFKMHLSTWCLWCELSNCCYCKNTQVCSSIIIIIIFTVHLISSSSPSSSSQLELYTASLTCAFRTPPYNYHDTDNY